MTTNHEEIAREAAEKCGFEIWQKYKVFNSGGLAVAVLPYFREAIRQAVEQEQERVELLCQAYSDELAEDIEAVKGQTLETSLHLMRGTVEELRRRIRNRSQEGR